MDGTVLFNIIQPESCLVLNVACYIFLAYESISHHFARTDACENKRRHLVVFVFLCGSSIVVEYLYTVIQLLVGYHIFILFEMIVIVLSDELLINIPSLLTAAFICTHICALIRSLISFLGQHARIENTRICLINQSNI